MAVGDIVSGYVTSQGQVNVTSGETWHINVASDTVWQGNYGRWEGPGCELGPTDGTGNTSLVRAKVNVGGTYRTAFDWRGPLDLFVTGASHFYVYPYSTMGWRGVVTSTSTGVNSGKVAVSSIASSAYWTVQPSSGEEWCLTEFGGHWSARSTEPQFGDCFVGCDIQLIYYDGTNSSIVRAPGYNNWWTVQQGRPMRVFVTNSQYFRLQNAWTSTFYLTYSGFRTK